VIFSFHSCTSSVHNTAQSIARDIGNQFLVFCLVRFVHRHKTGDVLALTVSVNIREVDSVIFISEECLVISHESHVVVDWHNHEITRAD
jgi:hypothetical protein